MRPLFEKVTVPDGASWALLNRRLDDGIPFLWHYHPEFELTLTLNSRGQRYIGDSAPPRRSTPASRISRLSCGSPRRGAKRSPAR
jgi:hypothetical protein